MKTIINVLKQEKDYILFVIGAILFQIAVFTTYYFIKY